MKISLAKEGGWLAGADRPSETVDLDFVDDQSQHHARSLVEKLTKSAPSSHGHSRQSRDATQFTIEIEEGAKKTTYSQVSTDLSPEFAELLTWLQRQNASRRSH